MRSPLLSSWGQFQGRPVISIVILFEGKACGQDLFWHCAWALHWP